MKAKGPDNNWLFVGLGCFCIALMASCRGDGVGLTESGDVQRTVTIGPVKDNTLYESATGALSNGAGGHLFAGRTGQGFIRRGLLAFDIAGNIPPGATIKSVTLSLHMSREPTAGGAEVIELHRVLVDWGEGASDAPLEEGGGTAAAAGDATWIHTFFDTGFWGSAGGDFSQTVSASQTVDAIGSYSWSGPGMVNDVQSWLDTPAGNFGWILIGNEAGSFTTKRFDTRENSNASFQPVLRIGFAPK